MLYVEFRAIKETHRTGTDVAVLAVLGYRILLFLLILGAYAAFIGLAILYAPGPRPGDVGPPDLPPPGLGE
jgi:hypothetical protein